MSKVPNQLRVLFRADSSTQIGTGHLRRCLALAEALVREGATVAFVSRPWPGNVNQEVVRSGHDLLELPAIGEHGGLPHRGLRMDWLGVPPERDASETAALVARWGGASILVVDHYGIDSEWEARVRSLFQSIVVIDDLADRFHDCDVLTDPTPLPNAAERYSGCVTPRTRLLLGPRFALLRPEFARRRADHRNRDGAIRRICVTFGGVDNDDYSTRAIGAVRQALGPDILVDVVVGSGCPNLGKLRIIAENDSNVTIHTDLADLTPLMAMADLGIGAGGTTAWERACLGLPAIVSPIAENQREVTRALGLSLCTLEVQPGSSFETDATSMLATLVSQPALVRMMGSNSARLVDGRGAVRLARRVLDTPVALRRAALADMKPIWEWRNHPSVRQVSRDIEEIPWSVHEAWYRSALLDHNIVILIAYVEDSAIAVVRFDIQGEGAEVSIYLTPGNHGRGFGSTVLRQCEGWLEREKPEVRRLVADVRTDNSASRMAFEAAGYCAHRLLYEREVGNAEG